MNARPPGEWIAIEPLDQGEQTSDGGLVLPKAKARSFLRGRVLRLGPRARGVDPGDTVLYERQSANPAQDVPLDAEIFGGTPGRFAVLVRVRERAPERSTELDTAMEFHERVIRGLKWDWQDWPQKHIPQHVHDQMDYHQREMRRLQAQRQRARRTRRLAPSDDDGQPDGILAVQTWDEP